jgi:hypothetical protein
MSSCHNSVEGAVLLDTDYFINMVKVSSEICVGGVVGWPIPCFPHFGPRKLVFGDLGVDTCPRVTIPSPGTSEVASCLVDDGLVSTVAKGL